MLFYNWWTWWTPRLLLSAYLMPTERRSCRWLRKLACHLRSQHPLPMHSLEGLLQCRSTALHRIAPQVLIRVAHRRQLQPLRKWLAAAEYYIVLGTSCREGSCGRLFDSH